jgi:hypothetical protein
MKKFKIAKEEERILKNLEEDVPSVNTDSDEGFWGNNTTGHLLKGD